MRIKPFFSRQKMSPPFPNPGNPTTPFENHGHAWKQMSSLEIFLRRRTERRASVSLLCWPVLKSLEFKIINRAWRQILGRPTLEPKSSLL